MQEAESLPLVAREVLVRDVALTGDEPDGGEASEAAGVSRRGRGGGREPAGVRDKGT